jgi:hypothetical protein
LSAPRLSIIPAGAIFDRALEPRDLQVLGLLGIHIDKAGWCRRSQVKMAVQLRCGRSSIQRSLENLVTAGWVEKKRPPWSSEEGQPSNSYMYRVVLDRDDFDPSSLPDDGGSEAENSYAKTASEEGECPPVGTPSEGVCEGQMAAENAAEGAQQDGHPGAQPYVGTGAQPYVGTKNDPLERPPIERERDARAKDRQARFLVSFEARWPTAAADDRQRTAYAAGTLSEAEEVAALAGIAPFLENLKRLHRKTVPAGWRYLEEKRWTLLEQQEAATSAISTSYAPGSVEARAIATLHDLVGRETAFRTIWRKPDGTVSFPKPMTPQLRALGEISDASSAVLARNQAAAWNHFTAQFFSSGVTRRQFREGDRAPHPWPPKVDGTWSPTGPPDTLMSEQDFKDFTA